MPKTRNDMGESKITSQFKHMDILVKLKLVNK